MTPRLRLQLAAAAAGSLLLLPCTASLAQLAPAAPQNLTPASGTVPAIAVIDGGTQVALGWAQSLQPGLTLRPNAGQFLVCILIPTPAVPAPTCTAANYSWSETIAAPTPALTRSGNVFTFRPGRIYADAELDRPLRIGVAACVNAGFNCTASYTDVFLSTRNIVPVSIGDQNSTQFEWVFDLRADNTGTSAIPQYSGEVAYWEVLVTGTDTRTCLTTVDDDVLRNDESLWVIDNRGQTTPMKDVQRVNGAYAGLPVVGIYRTGSAYDLRNFTTGTTALPPRQAGRRARVRRERQLVCALPGPLIRARARARCCARLRSPLRRRCRCWPPAASGAVPRMATR